MIGGVKKVLSNYLGRYISLSTFSIIVLFFKTLTYHSSKYFNFLKLIIYQIFNSENFNLNYLIEIFIMNLLYNTHLFFYHLNYILSKKIYIKG